MSYVAIRFFFFSFSLHYYQAALSVTFGTNDADFHEFQHALLNCFIFYWPLFEWKGRKNWMKKCNSKTNTSLMVTIQFDSTGPALELYGDKRTNRCQFCDLFQLDGLRRKMAIKTQPSHLCAYVNELILDCNHFEELIK